MFSFNKSTDSNPSADSTRLFDRIKSFLLLAAANVRLSITEKLTLLLSGIAVALVVFAFVSVAAVFLSAAIAHLLASFMPLGWAYAIMFGVNVLMVALVLVFRKALIINPIARLICRLLLK